MHCTSNRTPAIFARTVFIFDAHFADFPFAIQRFVVFYLQSEISQYEIILIGPPHHRCGRRKLEAICFSFHFHFDFGYLQILSALFGITHWIVCLIACIQFFYVLFNILYLKDRVRVYFLQYCHAISLCTISFSSFCSFYLTWHLECTQFIIENLLLYFALWTRSQKWLEIVCVWNDDTGNLTIEWITKNLS